MFFHFKTKKDKKIEELQKENERLQKEIKLIQKPPLLFNYNKPNVVTYRTTHTLPYDSIYKHNELTILSDKLIEERVIDILAKGFIEAIKENMEILQIHDEFNHYTFYEATLKIVKQ